MELLRTHRYVVGIALLVITVFSYWFFFVRSQTEETMRNVYDVPLVNYAGEEVFIKQFTKKSDTVVFMWATWCPYCAQELRNLSVLKNQYGDDVTIVAVNRGESLAEASAFTNTLPGVQGITFLLDPADALYKGMGGYAMPETFFVAKRGDVAYHQRGPLDMEGAGARLKVLIEE